MHIFSIFHADEEINLKQQYPIYPPTIFVALFVINGFNLLA